MRRVVVGMDGSPGALAALRWAVRTVPPESKIQVIGAWEPWSWGIGIGQSSRSDDRARARTEFESIVDAALSGTSPAVQIERHLRDGFPADVLLDAADWADLLVVGERGHRGLKGALLGSTATEVLHRTELTTIVIPVPHDAA